MLKELEEKVKKNDTSNVHSYYERLTAKDAVDNYAKSGKGSVADGKAILETGKKAYQSLVGSLNDSMKLEHQYFIAKLVNQTYSREIHKVDYGHLKGVVNKLNPANFVALIPQPRSGGYSE